VVASVTPGTLTLPTLEGLAAPGATARVYVVLRTGNEKGSETVVVI